MKIVITLLLALSVHTISAQLQASQDIIVNDLPLGSIEDAQSRSNTCSPDLVQYTLAKATGMQMLEINNSTSAQAISQYFDAPQAITVNGINFYAYKTNATGGTNISVDVELYLAGADSTPTGAALASGSILVDTTFGGGALSVLSKTFNFVSPISVTQPYCVVIRNQSPNSVGLVCNNYSAIPADGAGEWLSSLVLFGTWTRSYSVNVGGTMFNADWLIHPNVSYGLTASASQDQNCLVNGGTMNYTNLSSPILQNRMYNQAAFVGNTNLSYTWDFGDGSPVENVFNASHTFGFGIFGVTLSDTLFGWSSNCTHDTVLYTGLNIVANFSELATGLSVAFTDLTANDDVSTNWLWDFGDGNTSTQQNPTHTYAAYGTYTVCLTAINSCMADSSCHTVNLTCPTPNAQFSSSSNGSQVDFTQSSTSPSPSNVMSWLWDFGDGNTSPASNPSHTYAATGTYTVCLTVTNDCGESDSVCSAISVVCPPPVVAFTTNTTLQQVDFSDMSVSNSAITIWLWDFGDGNTSSQQNPTHTYAAVGTYTVCLTVVNQCGADSSCMPVSVVCPGPIADYNFSANGIQVDYVDGSSSSASINNWLWDFGDGNTSSQQNPTHNFPATGTYISCLTVTDQCGSDSICRQVEVSNCPVPVAAYTYNQSSSLSIDYTDASTVSGLVSWLWDFGDGNTSSQQNPSHTYSTSGNYLVCLTVTDSCDVDSSCQMLAVQAVDIESIAFESVNVYPNPANDMLNLDLGSEIHKIEALTIMDATGRLVHQLSAEQLEQSLVVSTGNWPQGIYFVRLLGKERQERIIKLVVQR